MHLRLDDMTILPMLVVIPHSKDVGKLNQENGLFDRILASTFLHLCKYLAVPLETKPEDMPFMHVTTEEYHLRIIRRKKRSWEGAPIILVPEIEENIGPLLKSGFIDRVVDGWRSKYNTLRQISWYLELVVTLEDQELTADESEDRDHFPHPPFPISRSISSTSQQTLNESLHKSKRIRKS
jgi:hypothetical protein